MDIRSLLIGFFLGIIGSFFGALFSYLFGERRRRKEDFNKAAANFRDAFAPAIAEFNILTGSEKITRMLMDELITQSVAIEKFRPFVTPCRRKDYQEAWENYHQSHKRDGVSSIYFLDYTMGNEHERFSLFKQRINEILKFAEQ